MASSTYKKCETCTKLFKSKSQILANQKITSTKWLWMKNLWLALSKFFRLHPVNTPAIRCNIYNIFTSGSINVFAIFGPVIPHITWDFQEPLLVSCGDFNTLGAVLNWFSPKLANPCSIRRLNKLLLLINFSTYHQIWKNCHQSELFGFCILFLF